ncbi:hypothetical protein AMECASPLE_004976 [Ameca splendens]|uniref:Uncharacterized protein n=1 Tax=Ameca splendens TaxID=208324 RepID=A0ABV0YXQ4_9TELE
MYRPCQVSLRSECIIQLGVQVQPMTTSLRTLIFQLHLPFNNRFKNPLTVWKSHFNAL